MPQPLWRQRHERRLPESSEEAGVRTLRGELVRLGGQAVVATVSASMKWDQDEFARLGSFCKFLTTHNDVFVLDKS